MQLPDIFPEKKVFSDRSTEAMQKQMHPRSQRSPARKRNFFPGHSCRTMRRHPERLLFEVRSAALQTRNSCSGRNSRPTQKVRARVCSVVSLSSAPFLISWDFSRSKTNDVHDFCQQENFHPNGLSMGQPSKSDDEALVNFDSTD